MVVDPRTASGTALAVRDLSRTYGAGDVAVQALDGVSFEIAAGSMVCIMGKSGSGKSTLLRQVGLLDLPTDGTVLIEGHDVTGLDEGRRRVLRLERLGYVFQEFALLPELTAAENVFLPALMMGRPRTECRGRADELLAMFDLADRARHRPSELSGGQQQRVAIARALVNRPSILFADEPTGNLDSESSELVMEALARTNLELGVTIVFVSHDPDHRRYANDVIVLRDGQVVGPETA
jgi:putative ABC transport system ATP-binding protein